MRKLFFLPFLAAAALLGAVPSGLSRQADQIVANYRKIIVLTAQDDSKGAPAVAVMSFRAWQEKFGKDPSVVGAGVVINSQNPNPIHRGQQYQAAESSQWLYQRSSCGNLRWILVAAPCLRVFVVNLLAVPLTSACTLLGSFAKTRS